MGMHRIVVEKVRNSLGEFEDIKVEEDDVGRGKTLLVHVKMDLKKPLARGRKITLMGEKYWIPIHYKKLTKYVSLVGASFMKMASVYLLISRKVRIPNLIHGYVP